MMRTPVEKYEPGMHIALHQMADPLFHGIYQAEPPNSQPLQQYSFPEQHMRLPPSNMPSVSYILPSSEFDTFPAWNGEPGDFHSDFYPRPPSSTAPMEPLDVPMLDRSPRSSGSLSSSGRKRRVKLVQQKTKNLRRAPTKPAEIPEEEMYEEEDDWSNGECDVVFEGKAKHFCRWMDCNKSFRRLEHLKRHNDT